MSVTRWDPFQDLLSMQNEMNQLFNRFFGQQPRPGEAGQPAWWAPALDISERPDAYLVTVEVPGVKPEDLDITMEGGVLTVQGERRFQDDSVERQWHRVERRYGAFRRSITLPSQVKADAIEASFEDGVLHVMVPKAEAAMPKRIEVRAGGGPMQVEGRSTQAG
jgi:HSP20 family protein